MATAGSVEPPAVGGPLSDSPHQGLSPEIVALLEQPLNRKLVARRRTVQGETLRYLEGHVVIQQANRVFGYGNWGSELAGPIEYRPLATSDGTNGHGIYSASVRVTVRGCQPHADVGTGAVVEPTTEGHDTAIKGAVTDALKRAFRVFYVRWNTKQRC